MYNGWKNYYTWCCMLWLDNEYSTNKFMQELTEEIAAKYTDNETGSVDKDATAYDLARYIENMVQEDAYDHFDTAGMLSDLLTRAIQEIDFDEIAEHLVSDYIWE